MTDNQVVSKEHYEAALFLLRKTEDELHKAEVGLAAESDRADKAEASLSEVAESIRGDFSATALAVLKALEKWADA